MTWGQYGEAAVHETRRRLLGAPLPPYRPDLTACLDHFVIHAGEGGWWLAVARTVDAGG